MAGSLIYGEASAASPADVREQPIQPTVPVDPAELAVAGKSSTQVWLKSGQVSGGFKVAHSPGGESTIKSLMNWGDAHNEEENTTYAPKCEMLPN